MYYVLKINGFYDVFTNLPGRFIHGRDEVITQKPLERVSAYNMARRLNNPSNTIRRQLQTA